MEVELNFLRWCIAAVVDDQEFDAPDFGETPQRRLIRFAHRHGVVPWLYSRLKKKADVDPESLEQLSELNQLYALRQLMQQKQSLELSETLAAAGVNHAILKGSAISSRLYSNYGVARGTSDVDILITSNDIARVLDTCRANGYRPRNEELAKALVLALPRFGQLVRSNEVVFEHTQPEKLGIDIHWQIMPHFLFPMSTDHALAKSTTIEIQHGKVPVLDYVTQYIHLCVHGFHDRFFRLHQLLDVYLASKHSAWDLQEVTQRSKELGVFHQVQFAMTTADRMFSPPFESLVAGPAPIELRTIWGACLEPRANRARLQKPGHWSLSDRFNYLRHQMRCRSRTQSLFAPLLTRLKYSDVMLVDWMRRRWSPWLWYPTAMFLRLSRRTRQESTPN